MGLRGLARPFVMPLSTQCFRLELRCFEIKFTMYFLMRTVSVAYGCRCGDVQTPFVGLLATMVALFPSEPNRRPGSFGLVNQSHPFPCLYLLTTLLLYLNTRVRDCPLGMHVIQFWTVLSTNEHGLDSICCSTCQLYKLPRWHDIYFCFVLFFSIHDFWHSDRYCTIVLSVWTDQTDLMPRMHNIILFNTKSVHLITLMSCLSVQTSECLYAKRA